jgi:hypothetical protein
LFDRLHFDGQNQHLVKSGRTLDMQLRVNRVCGFTVAFRANFKELVLPISGNGPLIHDGWIVLLIAAVGEIDFINRPLVKYRQHSRQQCGLGIRPSMLSPATDPIKTIARHEITSSSKIDRASCVRQANQLNEAFERLSAYGLSHDKERLLRETIVFLHERAGLPVPNFNVGVQ